MLAQPAVAVVAAALQGEGRPQAAANLVSLQPKVQAPRAWHSSINLHLANNLVLSQPVGAVGRVDNRMQLVQEESRAEEHHRLTAQQQV
jgi:hypothetical protein